MLGGTPVYVFTPPHHCTCGSNDCIPELNPTKLRQILALKRLLENGQDIKSLLFRTSGEGTSQSQTEHKDELVTKQDSKADDSDGGYATGIMMHGGEKESTCGKDKKKKDKMDKKYQCSECAKKCRSQSSLDKHLKRHAGGTLHKCELCLKTFDNSKGLKKHVKKEHDLSCKEMGRRVDDIQKSNKKYECHSCDKTFNKGNSCALHLVSHNDERPHSCAKCGKSFKIAASLSIHKKHCGKPPQVHQCRFCDRQFKCQSQCAEHERTHTNERPFQCQFCEKRFKTRQHATIHERIHTGEMPYECGDCRKRFKSAATFAAHKRQHDAKFPHVCEHCGKGFQIRRLLVEHLRTHTGKYLHQGPVSQRVKINL